MIPSTPRTLLQVLSAGAKHPSRRHSGLLLMTWLKNKQNCRARSSHDIRVPIAKRTSISQRRNVRSELLKRFATRGSETGRTCGLTCRVRISLGRSSSLQLNFLLKKLGLRCLTFEIALELVLAPTWANPANAPSRNRPIESRRCSLLMLPPLRNAVLNARAFRREY